MKKEKRSEVLYILKHTNIKQYSYSKTILDVVNELNIKDFNSSELYDIALEFYRMNVALAAQRKVNQPRMTYNQIAEIFLVAPADVKKYKQSGILPQRIPDCLV